MDYNIVFYRQESIASLHKNEGQYYKCNVMNVDSEEELLYHACSASTSTMVVLTMGTNKSEIYLLTSIIKKLGNTKIIYILSESNMCEKARCLGNGALACLDKNFKSDELFRTCINFLYVEKERMKLQKEKIMLENLSKKQFILSDDDLELNLKKRTVKYNETESKLTPQTFDILLYLVENKNTVKSREEICQNIEGYSFVNSRNIDTHIKLIRKIIGNKIHTKRGIGYYYC